MTKEGITKVPEAIKAVGHGGFQQFDAGFGVPEGEVEFNTDRYHKMIAFVINTGAFKALLSGG